MSEDLSVRESVIEKYLVRRLKEFDHRTVVKKIGGPGWRGWPDRLALHVVGVTHWLEVKRPKNGKFEPLQLRCHRELRKRGFVVRVVNTKRLVDEYIEELRSLGAAMLLPEQPGFEL